MKRKPNSFAAAVCLAVAIGAAGPAMAGDVEAGAKVFKKCKTNPELQDQTRTVFVTRPNGEPEWFGLPELYDGSL